MKYILIVDDIKIIRSGIRTILTENYSNIGIYEAENGDEALKIIKSYDIDFIITDVKMPVCDGLEMTRKIRNLKNSVPIIIVSGFGEFSYAQGALQLGVNDYLLKPIDGNKLCQAVDKIIQLPKVQEEMPFVKSAYLKDQEDRISRIMIVQNALLLSAQLPVHNDFTNKYYCAATIEIPNDFPEKTSFLSDELNLVKYVIQNITEYLELGIEYYYFNNPLSEYQILFVFYCEDKENIQKLTFSAIQKLVFEMEHTVNIPVYVGISNGDKVLNHELYKNSMKALGQRFVYQTQNIFVYQINSNISVGLNSESDELIEHCIKQKDLIQLRSVLNIIFDKYTKQGTVVDFINHLFYSASKSIITCFGYPGFEVVDQMIFKTAMLCEMKDSQQLLDKLVLVIGNNFLDGKDIEANKGIIECVKEYIDLNYSDNNITVKSLADQFNINYSYLSSLFAQEIGMGIVAYIKKIRIDRAKNLLVKTTTNIGNISQAVGYEDIQYFYRVFKKYTGQTPLAYRNHTKNVQ